MIAPYHTDGLDVVDSRYWHVATCATPELANQITDALNDAAMLKVKLALIAGRPPTLTEQAARAVAKDRP